MPYRTRRSLLAAVFVAPLFFHDFSFRIKKDAPCCLLRSPSFRSVDDLVNEWKRPAGLDQGPKKIKAARSFSFPLAKRITLRQRCSQRNDTLDISWKIREKSSLLFLQLEWMPLKMLINLINSWRSSNIFRRGQGLLLRCRRLFW